MEESHSNFDPKVYLELYPDLNRAYTIKTAWNHYKEYGKRDNRIFTNKSLIKLFDGVAYCKMYPDVKVNYTTDLAWIHYLSSGINESRQFYIKGKSNHYMNHIVNTVIKQEQKISLQRAYRVLLYRHLMKLMMFKKLFKNIGKLYLA